MKKCFIILFLLLMVSFALAEKGEIEVYLPNQMVDLSIHLTDVDGEVSDGNCSVRIMNNSWETITHGKMNQIGGGWYNYTFNTSKVGKYYCRQNCTRADEYVASTCDFIIKGDTNMSIAIIISILGIIIFYIFMFRMFTMDSLKEHGGIKLFFMLLAFWLMLIPLNFAIQFNDFYGGPSGISGILLALYPWIIWLNILITFYFIIFFIVHMVKNLQETAQRRKYEK